MHSFPVFRRSSNGRHFFRIDAEDRFIEVQLIGGRRVVHEVVARSYPERLRIAEMLEMKEAFWRSISQTEFEQALPPPG